MTSNINSQESPQGACHVWADPHLLMFPVHPAEENSRMGYWCQTPGRVLVLKNEFIEIYVNVTKLPFWNERVDDEVVAVLHKLFLSSLKSNFYPALKRCAPSRLNNQPVTTSVSERKNPIAPTFSASFERFKHQIRSGHSVQRSGPTQCDREFLRRFDRNELGSMSQIAFR